MMLATGNLFLIKSILLPLGVPAVLMFIGATVLLAQNSDQTPPAVDQSDLVQSAASAPVVLPAPAYIPLTLTQKYLYSLGEIFGPDRLVAVAGYAVLDQMGVKPAQWGKRPSSLAVRFASHFGDSLLKHNIEFGVRAVDHEDPRYFRSGRGRPWTRVGYAVYHTFVVHNDRGGWMLAYSLAAEAYGTPYLVRRWQPARFQTASTLEAGTVNVGIEIGTNLLKEFWPDLRNALPSWMTRNNPLLPAVVY
jgi:hypothetical protein